MGEDGGSGPTEARRAQMLPGYERLVEIGRGGFAVVYQAWQPAFTRHVAVKVISTVLDPAALKRFERECLAVGALSGHPHIVTVHEMGRTVEGRPYIVMEFLEGGSVAQRLTREGPMDWREVLDMGIKLAGSLEAAHRIGILHRDIKPENVLLSRFGEPKLADFGIATVQGRTETRSGVITASIAYAAPEVLGGQRPSVASDLYSLASMLHMLMTGDPPFLHPDDESILPILARVAGDPVPDLRPKGIPEPLCELIERAMAKEPSARPSSAVDMARALQSAQTATGEPVTRLPLEGEGPSAAAGRTPAPGSGSSAITDSASRTITTGAAATNGPGASTVEAIGPPPPVGPAGGGDGTRRWRRRRGTPAGQGDAPGAEPRTRAPTSSAPFVVSAIVLLLLTFGVARTRSAPSATLGDLPPGAVLVNTVDPLTAPEIRLDLSQPLVIAGMVEPGSVQRLRIEFTAIGIPLGSGTADVRQQEDGSYMVRIDSTEAARYFVGGKSTAKITLLGREDPATGRRPAKQRSFSVEAAHSRLKTVPAAVAAILVLFLLAYVKSSIYWMTYGDRRGFESTNLVIGGILAGLTAVIVSWLFGGSEPTLGAFAACALLGALTGAATGIAAFRVAQRRAAV